MANPNIPTPHITAKEGDFARTVLMPGDPLRSKFIAETYLENAVLVNDTRGVQGCIRASAFPSWPLAWASLRWASIPMSCSTITG